jgi:hypothetical protein
MWNQNMYVCTHVKNAHNKGEENERNTFCRASAQITGIGNLFKASFKNQILSGFHWFSMVGRTSSQRKEAATIRIKKPKQPAAV